MFALAFIITFSFIVTALDLVLLKFLIFLRKFRSALAPKIDRWIQDGVFQLQRRAYEAQDGIAWEHLEKEIPITVHIDQLEDLPIETSRLVCTHGCEKCSSSGVSGDPHGAGDEISATGVGFPENVDSVEGNVNNVTVTVDDSQGSTEEHQGDVNNVTVTVDNSQGSIEEHQGDTESDTAHMQLGRSLSEVSAAVSPRNVEVRRLRSAPGQVLASTL